MSPSLFKRLASLIAVGAISAIGLALPAQGDDGVTVGLSDLKSASGGVSGVLTVRSTDPLEVDAASLVASIDGADGTVTIQRATRVERRAILLIDTSGSMGSAGMTTVRSAAAAYLQVVPSDALVGVASFANTAGVDLAPTKDRAAVQRVVNGLSARGDTSLYAGVQSAIQALGSRGDRSIVLLSDGADTVAPDEGKARAQATAALKRAGIRVDVVRFNTNDPDATAALSGFASTNGGSVVAANNRKAVTAAFQTSARALDSQSQFLVEHAGSLTGSHTVRLRGTAGSTRFDVEQVASFGPAAAGAPSVAPSAGVVASPAGRVAVAPSTPWLPYVAAGLVALALILLGIGSLAPVASRRDLRVASIEQYVPFQRVRSRSEGKPHQAPIAEQLLGLGERVMKDRPSTTRTMELINRADLPLRAGEWFILRAVAVVAMVAIFYVLLRSSPLLGLLIGGLLGFFLPPYALRFLAARRAKKFERQLPDVLMLVATSLRSGFGLPQAMDAVARDAAEPAGKEFSRSLAETRIGTDMSDALEHMAERMASTSMRWAVMAIRIQREVGGNLAETLSTTAHTLRERESLHRQVRTLSAEGRLSAYILIALPIFVFFYMMLVNPGYLSLLWTTTFGLIMSVAGILLLIVGVLWMRRVVKIEV